MSERQMSQSFEMHITQFEQNLTAKSWVFHASRSGRYGGDKVGLRATAGSVRALTETKSRTLTEKKNSTSQFINARKGLSAQKRP